jgi:hypothetical protein
LRNIARNLLRTKDTTISITYQREDLINTTSIHCYNDEEVKKLIPTKESDSCCRYISPNNSLIYPMNGNINPGIGYIYPGKLKNDDLSNAMDYFLNAKGIIIDMRCYPSEFIVFTLSKYLMPEEINIVKWSGGNIMTPGLFTFTQPTKVGSKNDKYYKGKIVIIVNEITQSNAEYTTMALRIAPKATVIGSTTAGADGNVSEINLPGGIKTAISGIGVYYPDGRETQRVGIVPDIEIHPTIKGIREGRDELLDKAIEIINSGK